MPAYTSTLATAVPTQMTNIELGSEEDPEEHQLDEDAAEAQELEELQESFYHVLHISTDRLLVLHQDEIVGAMKTSKSISFLGSIAFQ